MKSFASTVLFAFVASACAASAPSSPSGRLPPQVIQSVVRGSFGPMRVCYEQGLRNNGELTGRVTTKFVIDPDGTVRMVADAGSDLPDPKVVECVVRTFGTLQFPQPEGGPVTVVYPIMFHPGD
jgi:hypothetical protein